MNLTKNKTRQLLQFLSFVLFFVAGTFYLYNYTNYIFFYQEKASLFLVSFSYLLEHLNQPGGFLVYLNNLQTAFYYYPLVGAIVAVSEVLLCIYLMGKISFILIHKSFYFLPFLVGALLFYLQISYEYVAFNNLGILFQLLLLYTSIRFFSDRKSWLPVILFPVVYFLFGIFSALFLFMCSLLFAQKKEWLKLSLLWGLTIVFFFVGREFLFYQTTKILVFFPYESKKVGEQIYLFSVTAGLVALLPLWGKLKWNKFSKISIKSITLPEISPFLIVGVLAFFAASKIDKKINYFFYAEKLFYEQKYEELIAFNYRYPSGNMLTNFTNNVALAETGKLADSFFSFRQDPDGGTLFLKWDILGAVLRRGGHFYYSVGIINEAQRWAYEYLVMRGNTPEALKMMIKTDLIKGKYKIAEKYISILEESVFYRDEAKEFRNLLFNDKAVSAHAELGKKQLLDAKQDFFIQTDDLAVNLDLIIEADAINVPAIEYKLAWLMLQKDMKGVVDMLPVMEKAGYSKIPKNVEEVVATYQLMRVGEMPALKRLKVSRQTEQRFQLFYRTFQQNQDSKQQAQRALSKDFWNTYWYYVFFY